MKKRVGIIFGGISGEHEISLRSAKAVIDAIDRQAYDVVLIGISPTGRWQLFDQASFDQITGSSLTRLPEDRDEVLLINGSEGSELINRNNPLQPIGNLDVVFPVLHGTYGEDGTVQGFLELAGVAYVGAGVLGSALGMDKEVQKRLLAHARLPLLPYIPGTAFDWQNDRETFRNEVLKLGFPLFTKPANLGSSVGIRKVEDEAALDEALDFALRYDTKLVVEKGIDAREIECAVLGNEIVEVSIPGEIRPKHDFYSYESKYLDDDGAELLIPAELSEEESEHVRRLAARVFQVLECSGMARVDFLLDRKSGELYVNELNSIPGFTPISMYPKLWEATGLPYPKLIDRLIELAIDRHRMRDSLETTQKT